MYPTISDLLKGLFGFYIPLPIQTFGFFMALSFAGAYYFILREIIRKQQQGIFPEIKKSIQINVPISVMDHIYNTVFGAIIGYKLLAMVLHYDILVQSPQDFILSMYGSAPGAVIGAVIGYYLKYQEAKKVEGKEVQTREIRVQAQDHMGYFFALAFIGGLLGAKLFHNLENLGDFMRDPIGSLFSFSGLTFYGGLIVAAWLIIRYAVKNGMPAWDICDAHAPGLMLAYGIGRIGCHISGDGDWGIQNSLPKPAWLSAFPDWFWGYTYPHNVVHEGIPIPGCESNFCTELPYPVFPTPLYEAIVCILLFVGLWLLRKHLRKSGLLFSVYLMVNGLERFLIEKIRINSTYDILGSHITQAEIISFALFFFGMILMYLVYQGKIPNSEIKSA